MRTIFTGPQSMALRVLAAGPQRKAQFDGRTVMSLLAHHLVSCLDDGTLELTERGRHFADLEVANAPAPIAEPPIATSKVALPPVDGMAEICCEGFEAAVAAGMLVLDSHGQAYMRQGTKAWYISRCPWCAEEERA